MEMGIPFGITAFSSVSRGSSIPVIIAERIWMPHRTHGIHHHENLPAAMPNRKAGPALLQNPSILLALFVESLPSCHAAEIHCAPTGYPPSNPTASKLSAPMGIPQIRPRGRRKTDEPPPMLDVSIMERMKKGRRDGITTLRHKSIPSAAPDKAVWLSIINISIPIPDKTAVTILRFN